MKLLRIAGVVVFLTMILIHKEKQDRRERQNKMMDSCLYYKNKMIRYINDPGLEKFNLYGDSADYYFNKWRATK